MNNDPSVYRIICHDPSTHETQITAWFAHPADAAVAFALEYMKGKEARLLATYAIAEMYTSREMSGKFGDVTITIEERP